MSNWLACPHCGLKHRARPDGFCPRCGQSVSDASLGPTSFAQTSSRVVTDDDDDMGKFYESMRAHPRVVGVIILLIGLVACYFLILSPIREAEIGVETITLSSKGVLLAILGLCMGLAQTVLGPLVAPIFWPREGESKLPAYATGVAVATVAFLIYLGIENYIIGLGYQFEPLFKF